MTKDEFFPLRAGWDHVADLLTDESSYPDGLSRSEWLQVIEERRNPFYKYPGGTQRIWRYMDFTKFVALLDQQALFFPKASLLDDPYEGSISLENLRRRPQLVERRVEAFKEIIPPSEFNAELERKIRMPGESFYRDWSLRRRWLRDWTYISCWHMNDHESAAMWRLYATSNQAIAVQSTFDRLHECLQPHRWPPHGEPKLGQVYYLDYAQDVVTVDVHLSEFFCKRKSFSHEAELRAVIQELPLIPATPDDEGKVSSWHEDWERTPIPGKSLNVDVDKLIEKVYVAPTAPGWFHDLTKRVVEKYGLSKEVHHSSLDIDPVY